MIRIYKRKRHHHTSFGNTIFPYFFPLCVNVCVFCMLISLYYVQQKNAFMVELRETNSIVVDVE